MRIVVVGATGFIGRALVPALVKEGHHVRAAARRPWSRPPAGVECVVCDARRPDTLPAALTGRDVAYYLVHSLGAGQDFQALDREAALAFREAAAEANVGRIVYLGGVAPRGRPSAHLASRLEVGELLRRGPVLTLELRASMVVGAGSASWRIVRDLALRLPAMVLPAWLRSRTRPIALEDAVQALVDAADVPLSSRRWFDLPGPETLSGKQILLSIAALRGRRVPTLSLPWLSPTLSAMWLRLVTRADYSLARELVLGLAEDLLPASEDFWELSGHRPRLTFSEAAARALAAEPPEGRTEGIVDRLRAIPALRTD